MFGRFALSALLTLSLTVPAAAQRMVPRPGASRNIAAACAGVDPASEKSWSTPAPPAHVFGNTWYVGTCGITALLVETKAGLVLLDGGVPEAAPMVLANIRKLGFNPGEVRWILVSHEHWDHAGALAALQKATGAQVIAGPRQMNALMTGKPSSEDPQVPFFKGHDLLPVKVSRTMPDNGRLTVGAVSFTAIATPAHSPGSTSWVWRECEGGLCKTLAYADSVSTPAPDDYHFGDHPKRLGEVREGLAKMARISCDVVITPHPSASDLFRRISGTIPISASNGCFAYAQGGIERFQNRLVVETKSKKPEK
ncbi:subclass B3 metallo-beta-lactamase [Novosphingobium sp. MW5]|nr:subclass B3 metallo-beta-lactamase [Novosphingobium sp. MW5]